MIWELFAVLVQVVLYFGVFAAGMVIGQRRGQAQMMTQLGRALPPIAVSAECPDGHEHVLPMSEIRVTFVGIEGQTPTGTMVTSFIGGHETSPEVHRDLANMAIGVLERTLQEER